MAAGDALRLLLLAAMWGASFLFLRIAATALSPATLIESRTLLAALVLFGVALARGRPLRWRQFWREYLILGLSMAAVPFLLTAWAAQSLSASLMAILNATSPVWGALIASLWFRRRPPARALAGLALALAGVVALVGVDRTGNSGGLPPVLAMLAAAACYGLGSTWIQARAQASPGRAHADPADAAHGSLWAASLVVLPLALASPPAAVPDLEIVVAVLALGMLSTGVGYLIYFGLVSRIGPMGALTVTFLNPLFAALWAALVLGERITPQGALAGVAILVGTALATGFSPRSLWRRANA